MTSLVRSFVAVACVGATVVAFGACNRDRDRGTRGDRPMEPGIGEGEKGPGTTTVTGANVAVGNQAAVDRIVAARCARETTCKQRRSRQEVREQQRLHAELRSDMTEDLSVKDCRAGSIRRSSTSASTRSGASLAATRSTPSHASRPAARVTCA